MSLVDHQEACEESPPPTVNCDQEAWLKARILTAMRMALAVDREKIVGADNDLLQSALDGIANGCAVEVVHTLRLEPEYTNLRKVEFLGSGYSVPIRTLL